MKRLLTLAFALVAATPLMAQEAERAPILEVTFDETETIPGQYLSLRLTVLVPTFMPAPPVWPSLEAPNLLVRLPEGSTNPTSQTVDSKTWAGVTRHYRISPMVPGEFAIAPQTVTVTYADLDTNDPVKSTLTTDALTFSGVLPEGAEALDPFIAATDLELTQQLEGTPDRMVPGDGVTWTVVAQVHGTSPMFLPRLLPTISLDGVAAYPDEPVVEESDDRGVPTGTRTESIALLAEGGGRGQVPAISLDWYNLDSGEVETAALDGFVVAVDGPTAANANPRDWRAVAIAAAAGLTLLGLLLWLTPRIARPARDWLRKRRVARLASEGDAYAELRRAVSARDLRRLYPALDEWAPKVQGPDPRTSPEIQSALTRIGAERYARAPGRDHGAWFALRSALETARSASARTHVAAGTLPPLNPGM